VSLAYTCVLGYADTRDSEQKAMKLAQATIAGHRKLQVWTGWLIQPVPVLLMPSLLIPCVAIAPGNSLCS
jgi:hypothetical protein